MENLHPCSRELQHCNLKLYLPEFNTPHVFFFPTSLFQFLLSVWLITSCDVYDADVYGSLETVSIKGC